METEQNEKLRNDHPLEVFRDSSQMPLELTLRKYGFWTKIRHQLEDVEREYSARPFWKSGVNVFALSSIIFTFITSILILIWFRDKLPNEMPVFYEHVDKTWGLYPTYGFYFVFAVVIILQSFTFYLSYKIYGLDRRLSRILNLLIIYCVVIFFIAINQLIGIKVI